MSVDVEDLEFYSEEENKQKKKEVERLNCGAKEKGMQGRTKESFAEHGKGASCREVSLL